MRHQKAINHLGRTSSHRKAMLSNMASSLIKYKRINTTVAKAKALRSFVEPIITGAKNDSTHARRMAFSVLQDKEAVTELFREISVKVADRPGGYLRILKTGYRLGDNADMCMVELVDYGVNADAAPKKETAKKTTRRGRSGAKKTTESASKPEVSDQVTEEKEAPKAKKAAPKKAETEAKEKAPKKTTAKDKKEE